MSNKKITLEFEGDDLKINEEGVFHFKETVTVLSNYMLHIMKKFNEAVPEEHQERTKQLIYDTMNEHFTVILEKFAPEYELRPDLTVDAIAKAEHEILSKMSDETPKE